MRANADAELPEAKLNRLLRAVDWRFLLRQAKRPRALVLGAPREVVEGVELISDPAGEGPGEADLVVIGFPTRRRLRRARQALRPDGELVCYWRLPRIAGGRRAQARLRRAGFEPESVHWPGPHPARTPEFWLPLGEPAAATHLFGQRAPRSRSEAALRRLVRVAVALDVVAPLCVLARQTETERSRDDLDAISAALGSDPVLMLTEGDRPRHKVVSLPFAAQTPVVVVKHARIAATDDSLQREATALSELEQRFPQLDPAPRLIAVGRRAGRCAIVEQVVPGALPPAPLTQAMFARLAPAVTSLLVGLVDGPPPQPAASWRRRLVEGPLERFEKHFGDRVGAAAIGSTRRLLADLPDLPLAWEHRDCAVWNVHLDRLGRVGMFDWAGSDPEGLPGLDLAYFLATSAFMIDRVRMSDPEAVLASYETVFDPTTPRGRVAATCVERYFERLDLDPRIFPLLRLRSWIVKADPKDPAAASFARLVAAELRGLGVPR